MDRPSRSRHADKTSSRVMRHEAKLSRGKIVEQRAMSTTQSSYRSALSLIPAPMERFSPSSGTDQNNVPLGQLCELPVTSEHDNLGFRHLAVQWLYTTEDHLRDPGYERYIAPHYAYLLPGHNTSAPISTEDHTEADEELVGMGLYDDPPKHVFADATTFRQGPNEPNAFSSSTSTPANGLLLGEAFQPQISEAGYELHDDISNLHDGYTYNYTPEGALENGYSFSGGLDCVGSHVDEYGYWHVPEPPLLPHDAINLAGPGIGGSWDAVYDELPGHLDPFWFDAIRGRRHVVEVPVGHRVSVGGYCYH